MSSQFRASGSPTEQVAAAIKAHRRCYEASPVQGKWHCAGCNHWVDDHDEHVVAAVVAALSQRLVTAWVPSVEQANQ